MSHRIEPKRRGRTLEGGGPLPGEAALLQCSAVHLPRGADYDRLCGQHQGKTLFIAGTGLMVVVKWRLPLMLK
ncbi:hypothetical protein ACLK19_02440 [Escherichia coli]